MPLDMPETEAPHPGVSLGGVDVEGAVLVRARDCGSGSGVGNFQANQVNHKPIS